ncbi:MAG TPA: type VI secretion system membrane subunit TssM [Aliidongia sp.]|nr:type VI secretion system membrane subunit TssM [Aliidongia sp.]
MQNVEALIAYFLNRWTTSFAGIGMASLIVWYLGPLVPGFQNPLMRVGLILIFVLVWGAVNGALSWRRRRRENALVDGVAKGDAGPSRDLRADKAEEVGRLRERMRGALARLRAKGTRGYLYEQPWFVLIGPPGSGKTTALLNSGLSFPLAQDGTDASVGGVGGTRLCDWWFADEAVLIDTAGRYTTQDSDAAVDRAGWEGFLDLLRRARPRQPINGVVTIISLAELAAASPAERAAHARAVRRRVTEISDRLRLRIPVYAVFSKADQIVGFNEYFDDLDAEARAQVWGATFPLAKGVESFAEEFRLLLARLDERLFERLQAERSADRRVLIAGFPLQVASLEQPLLDFMTQAFGGTKLDPAPFLRGAYLTSATQEGTPIDRLTGVLVRSFGIDQKKLSSLRPTAGRAYFLKRMLTEVVLGEAMLVVNNSAKLRRRRWLRIGGYAGVGVATLVAALLLIRTESANRVAVEHAEEAIAAYRTQLAAIKLDPVEDDDLIHVVPLLDAAQALPQAQEGWLMNLPGLDQAEKLAESNKAVYRHVLERVLLPRLIWRIEQQMRGQFDKPDFLYEATRVYLMLGGAGPLDADLVRDWMTLDWRSRFPGALNEKLRKDLLAHLNALLAEPLPAVTLDGALVGTARASFSRVSLAERVYSRARPDASATHVADWTPAMVLGSAGTPLFTRISGKPLTDGIPGFYTEEGFREVLLRNLAATTKKVADESWVLGRNEQIPTDGPQIQELERNVVALYVADYEKQWDAMLNDLALAPFGNRATAIQNLYVLSSPQSPMRDLLISIAHELSLAQTPNPAVEGDKQAPATNTQQKYLAGVIGAAPANAAPPEPPVSAELERHYQPLRDFVGDGKTAPLNNVLRVVNSLQQELAQLGPNAANVPATLQSGGDPVQLLTAEAQRQPQPVSRWLSQIASSGTSMLGGGAQDAATAAFSGSDGPDKLCQAVVTGHYPFEAGAAQEAPLDDFARLFAPGGMLDSFFQTQIKPFVNTTGAVWKPQPLGGVAAPVNAAAVAQFQRAAAIRDMFFPTGSSQPQVRFSVAPFATDSGTKQAVLTLGSTSIQAGGGSTQESALSWPGPDGMSVASLSFDPPADGEPLKADGSWALFRLLEKAQIVPSDKPVEYRATFHQGSHEADFTLRAGSSRNPFGQNLLKDFRCPSLKSPS